MIPEKAGWLKGNHQIINDILETGIEEKGKAKTVLFRVHFTFTSPIRTQGRDERVRDEKDSFAF